LHSYRLRRKKLLLASWPTAPGPPTRPEPFPISSTLTLSEWESARRSKGDSQQARTRFGYMLTENFPKPRFRNRSWYPRRYGASRQMWLRPAGSEPSLWRQRQHLEIASGPSDQAVRSVLPRSETWSRRGRLAR